jgi:hypothetical protein
MSMTSRRLTHLGLLATLLAGCGGIAEEEIASAAVTSALEISKNSATGNAVLEAKYAEPPSSCSTPEQAAARAAATPSAVLRPSTCITKTADGASVHAELASCTGIFGRRILNGGLDARFEACEGGAQTAEIHDSGDLTANGRPLSYQAKAVLATVEGGRDVTYTAQWSGTTARGRFVTGNAELAVWVADPSGCIRVTGDANGRVDDIAFQKTISGFALCPDQCPTDGRLDVTVQGKRGERTMTITFDGTDRAKVIGFSGRHFDVPLVCDE